MLLMGRRDERRRWRAAAVSAVVLWAFAAHAAKSNEKKTPAEVAPVPAARIAVAPLGFLPPSPAYLHLRLSWASLNFIDKNHLLFTFHVNQLLQRSPEDMAGGNDQMIRADVLDIATGKVLQTAEWRMFDRGRYIWGLRDGKFVVRRRNALYLMDSSLDLKPYLMFNSELQGLEISPERTLMMLEVKKVLSVAEGDREKNAPSLLERGERPTGLLTRTEMVLLHPGERTVLARAELRLPQALPLMDDGILESIEGSSSKQWLIEKEGPGKKLEKEGNVLSACAPQLQPLSGDVALAETCPLNGENGSTVVAMKMGGEVLWWDKWQSRYIWPTFEYSEDGSRFAYESMQADRDIGTMDEFGEADIVAQPVGVFDTDTGRLVLVEDATPILSEGQNFALSADGREFAILRGGAIEVYDLPAVEKQPAGKSASERVSKSAGHR